MVEAPGGYLTVPEAAAYLRVSVRLLYRDLVHDRDVPRYRVGARLLFARDDLDGWMARRWRVAGDAPGAVRADHNPDHKGRARRKPAAPAEVGS